MIKQGTIVLVPFPFTDLSSKKVRPALVISKESVQADIILAFISSKPKKGYYSVIVKPNEVNGLKSDSSIICSKIATLEKSILLGEIGVINKEIMNKVSLKLKNLFNIK